MFETTINPRFNETDALGHINNNVYSIWFDSAREPIYKYFCSTNDFRDIDLIMAKISCEFLNEVFYGKEVLIKTQIERIGNSSFEVHHQLFQNDKLCSVGNATLVHFDHKEKQSIILGDEKKEFLEKHLI